MSLLRDSKQEEEKMTVFNYNPLKLIEEVKKRPGLYRSEQPVMDREEKLALWKEIGAALHNDWNDCNKATAYDRVLQLQRKWRSLRDAYNRELRARRTGVRPNKRVYMYFKRMSFLGGFEGNLSDGDELADDLHYIHEDPTLQSEDPLTAILPTTTKKPRKKHTRKRSYHSDPPEELEMAFPVELQEMNETTERMDESDSDKLFLLSFLPEMRQLPVNTKMWARAQIANIMQEAVSSHYSNTLPSLEKNRLEIKRQRRDSSD